VAKPLESRPMAPDTLIAQQVADVLQGRDPSRFKRLRDATESYKKSIHKAHATNMQPSLYTLGLTNGFIMALSIIDETYPELMDMDVFYDPSNN